MKHLNPVLGENLGDLHFAELECQRSASTQALWNCDLGANREDLRRLPTPT